MKASRCGDWDPDWRETGSLRSQNQFAALYRLFLLSNVSNGSHHLCQVSFHVHVAFSCRYQGEVEASLVRILQAKATENSSFLSHLIRLLP